jgi:phosphopantothenoylcysteine decarboxylase/phosphopantothenate--cysteine ligase
VSLKGLKAIVTSGPTYEPIDPVRFIGNRSSGKQGAAIADALADVGVSVTFISGPGATPQNPVIKIVNIQTAVEMLAACEAALPADIFIAAAAISDWAPEIKFDRKIKKREDAAPPVIKLKENPDILKTISHHARRPKLVIGFAAETEDLLKNAHSKLERKGCDWILANIAQETFGSDENQILFVTKTAHEEWPRQSKQAVAKTLAQKITIYFE